MNLALFRLQLYNGYIRNGEKIEQQFYQENIRSQAFFVYFFVRNRIIAARGKGGGLAFWVKMQSKT
ncbi:MAG: hypothetical protein GDA44_13915 [Prochloron sp. SP5CPC1]|nr:hypothetical protein [Candidatus Paraprochloron terpiosi SP5CPC1]